MRIPHGRREKKKVRKLVANWIIAVLFVRIRLVHGNGARQTKLRLIKTLCALLYGGKNGRPAVFDKDFFIASTRNGEGVRYAIAIL